MHIVLDFDKLLETIKRLHQRINERFACSRLNLVASELAEMAEKSSEDIAWINKPNLWLRLGVAILIALMAWSAYLTWPEFQVHKGQMTQVLMLQVGESIFNLLLLVAAGIFFLFSMENRIKRSRLIRSLHRLREIAHIVDMLQLTKDPYYSAGLGQKTASSPDRDMTIYELQRYLDYCSEMLSLVGKLAALYVKHFPDPDVTSSVNEVEVLCTNLSRKIWQKIMIANSIEQKEGKDYNLIVGD
ncbi:hypothetical protein HR060_05575 [Catenovulum sp. SM1970]|uniref:hypothetical protein n=1 Tax=Marinifaba aquimaris TaxID=2741323 RepID=UPI001574A380|nr:hypothetical protein [Marinifaba aquimaris]NTS76333.1 hypothetical protein [Marinifaba aquimaris]